MTCGRQIETQRRILPQPKQPKQQTTKTTNNQQPKQSRGKNKNDSDAGNCSISLFTWIHFTWRSVTLDGFYVQQIDQAASKWDISHGVLVYLCELIDKLMQTQPLWHEWWPGERCVFSLSLSLDDRCLPINGCISSLALASHMCWNGGHCIIVKRENTISA